MKKPNRHKSVIFAKLILLFLAAAGLYTPATFGQRGRSRPSRPSRPEPYRPTYQPIRPSSERQGESSRSEERTGGYGDQSTSKETAGTEKTERLYEPIKPFEEHLSDIASPKPPDSENWGKFSRERIEFEPSFEAPSDASSVSQRLIENPKFMVFLPIEKEYEETFEKPYTAKADAEMTFASSKFIELSPGNVQILRQTNKTSLLEEVAAVKAQPLVLVAHSIKEGDRRKVRLSDRSLVDVGEIERAALAAGTTCIVITCHGKDLGVNRDITLSEAYNICRRANEAYKTGDAKTVYDYIYYMRQEANSWKQSGITITIVATIGGVGTIITCSYEVDSSSDSYFWYYVATGSLASGGLIFAYKKTRRPNSAPDSKV